MVTLVKERATGKWKAALGPDRRIAEHRAFVHSLRVGGNKHDHFDEVWTLAPLRRVKLRPAHEKDDKPAKAGTVATLAKRLAAAITG